MEIISKDAVHTLSGQRRSRIAFELWCSSCVVRVVLFGLNHFLH